MQKKTFIMLLSIVGLLTLPVQADPVQVSTGTDPIQDDWSIGGWVEELSTSPWNTPTQLISSQEVIWQGHIPCPSEYLGGGAVQVRIQNLTGRYFLELYYVGDVKNNGTLQTTFTNYDERVGDLSTGPSYKGLAFKIDHVGLNTPLVYESITWDNIFEPNEYWCFVIQEYANTLLLGPALLGSVGVNPLGAIAAASAGNPASSGSIITPEPATLSLLALGGLALLRRRKSKA